MSLADLQIVRHPPPDETNHPVGYGRADYALLTNPKGVAKIARKLSNSHHHFAFYMYFPSRGSILPTFDRKFLNDFVSEDQIATQINVVMSNNTAVVRNHRPPTAWTLIHRMMHCVEVNQKWNGAPVLNAISGLAEAVLPINACKPGVITNSILDWPRSPSFTEEDFKKFCYALLTMRCARERNFNIGGDIPAELLAQYVLTGRVRLNKAVDVIRISDEMRPAEELRRPVNLSELQARIDAAESLIEQELENLLTSLRGEVVAF